MTPHELAEHLDHDEDAHHDNHGHHGHDHPSPLRRLARILRPELGDIGIVALFSGVVGLLTLATPVAVESLVNTVAFGRLIQPIFILSLLLLTFLAFAASLRVLQAYVVEIIQRRLFVRVVDDLSRRLPGFQAGVGEDHLTPELVNRFFDVMTLQKSSATMVLDGITVVLQTTIGMIVLAFYHPYLLGFDVFLLIAAAILIFALGRGAVKTAISESKAKYAVAAWLQELAACPATFKGAGGPTHAMVVTDTLTTDYIQSRRQHFRVLMRQIIFSVGLQAIGSSLLLGLGGWLVLDGQLTLGQLVAAELIVAVILGTFTKFGKQMESFYDLLAAVDKVGHLLDLPMERAQGSPVVARPEPSALRVRRLSFGWTRHRLCLNDLSLEVPPGTIMAITGTPGSGKSTLLDLIYALREPTQGSIEFDGFDSRSLNPESLRRQIALVRRREIFSGTLAENVHINRSSIDLARVQDALSAVGLFDEVLTFPAGLETRLHCGGDPLSTSQASRLVLARALAGQPRLLLIDGILDDLPGDRVQIVWQTLLDARRHSTILLVTSREELASRCDQIIDLTPSGEPATQSTSAHVTSKRPAAKVGA